MKVAVSERKAPLAGLAVKQQGKPQMPFRQYLKQMNEAVQESVVSKETSDNEMEEGSERGCTYFDNDSYESCNDGCPCFSMRWYH